MESTNSNGGGPVCLYDVDYPGNPLRFESMVDTESPVVDLRKAASFEMISSLLVYIACLRVLNLTMTPDRRDKYRALRRSERNPL